MRKSMFIVAALLAATLSACSTTKRLTHAESASASTRLTRTADTVTISRLRTIVCDRPSLEITRHDSTDTVRITIRAERATVAELLDAAAARIARDSLAAQTSTVATSTAERTPASPSFPLWLKILCCLVFIVLSLREIRSRR